MSGIVVVSVVGILLLAVVVVAGFLEHEAHSADLVSYDLRFPRDLDVAGIESFLVGLCGLLPPWWRRRWLATPFVVLEVEGSERGITHRLIAPKRWVGVVEQQLRAAVPGVSYAAGNTAAVRVDHALEYRLSSNRRPVRVDAIGTATKLLASLQPLRADESVVVQWVLSPAPPTSPVKVASGKAGWSSWWSSQRSAPDDPEAVSAMRQKQAHPILLTAPRIAARATTVARARQLLRQTEVAFHGARAPGVQFRRRYLPKNLVARRVAARSVPLVEWPALLNVTELAGLIGWPIGGRQVAGLAMGGCRHLAPTAAVPMTGTVLGDAHVAGASRVVAMDLEARYRHALLVGPTGSGKSTLQLQMIVQDMLAGYAVLVVDPKSDLVEDVLRRVPQDRRGDVVVLDASDADRPIGFDPLRAAGVAPDLAAEQFVNVLHRLFEANWGVRSSDIWRGAVQTLSVEPSATLADVGTLLIDPRFRAQLVAKVTDPMTLGFWRWYDGLSLPEQHQAIAPVLNKFRSLLSRPGLRRTFAQPSPEFDLGAAIDRGGIVLVPLASGLLGDDAANLFGAVVLNSVWNLVRRRAALPPAQRRPLMVHLDEFARYLALPVPMDEMLAQARGYRVGLTIALQHLNQLPPELRQTVLANPRTRIAWQLGHADAQVMAREFGGELTAEDLGGLGAFQVVAQIYASGQSQAPCTVATRPAPDPTTDPNDLRQQSRERWGVDGPMLDAGLMERLNGDKRGTSLDRPAPGRKRRDDE